MAARCVAGVGVSDVVWGGSDLGLQLAERYKIVEEEACEADLPFVSGWGKVGVLGVHFRGTGRGFVVQGDVGRAVWVRASWRCPLIVPIAKPGRGIRLGNRRPSCLEIPDMIKLTIC